MSTNNNNNIYDMPLINDMIGDVKGILKYTFGS